LAVLASDIGSNSRKKFVGGFADLFVGRASRRSVAQELFHGFPEGQNVSRTFSRLEHAISHYYAKHTLFAFARIPFAAAAPSKVVRCELNALLFENCVVSIVGMGASNENAPA
jgi:hypothetical protein